MTDLEPVVLTHDLPQYRLSAGDVGTVVFHDEESRTYEVEFVCASGRTVAVVTLGPEDIRPLAAREILHVRELAA